MEQRSSIFQGQGTTVSDCGTYQYVEWIDLGENKRGVCTVLGLIPSVVREKGPDQVITTCMEFAKRCGYSKLALINLFALQNVDSISVPKLQDPVGPDNNTWIRTVAKESDIIIGAWGEFSGIGSRVYEVLALLKEFDIYCVQTNRNGSPTHPLAWRQKSPKMYRRGVSDSLQVAG